MKALDFLNKAGTFYLATTEGDQARVRPLGFVMDVNGKLAFCTSNKKKMFKQLNDNPKVEVCSIYKDFNTLRISGKVVFATSEETQTKALEIMPSLSKMYSIGDGKFEIFYIDEASANCFAMNGKKIDIEI